MLGEWEELEGREVEREGWEAASLKRLAFRSMLYNNFVVALFHGISNGSVLAELRGSKLLVESDLPWAQLLPLN